MSAIESVAGVVLAGGEGRRIGGMKALVELEGKPLVSHVADRLAPQVRTTWLSVRAPGAARFSDFGLPLCVDACEAARGPVAGISAALRTAAAAGFAAVVIAPCDTPFLPRDLVCQLVQALGNASVAFVADERDHPVVSLWRVAVLPEVDAALTAGRLRLQSLCDELVAVRVQRPAHWDEHALFNVNTRDDVLRAAGWVRAAERLEAGE